MKTVMTTMLGSALLATSLSAAAMDPEKQIETRQAGFSYMAWNMGKIKAQVIDGSVEYNQQQVEAAANTIAAIANSGIARCLVRVPRRTSVMCVPVQIRRCSKTCRMWLNWPATWVPPPTPWPRKRQPATSRKSAWRLPKWARPARPATTSTRWTESSG